MSEVPDRSGPNQRGFDRLACVCLLNTVLFAVCVWLSQNQVAGGLNSHADGWNTWGALRTLSGSLLALTCLAPVFARWTPGEPAPIKLFLLSAVASPFALAGLRTGFFHWELCGTVSHIDSHGGISIWRDDRIQLALVAGLLALLSWRKGNCLRDRAEREPLGRALWLWLTGSGLVLILSRPFQLGHAEALARAAWSQIIAADGVVSDPFFHGGHWPHPFGLEAQYALWQRLTDWDALAVQALGQALFGWMALALLYFVVAPLFEGAERAEPSSGPAKGPAKSEAGLQTVLLLGVACLAARVCAESALPKPILALAMAQLLCAVHAARHGQAPWHLLCALLGALLLWSEPWLALLSLSAQCLAGVLVTLPGNVASPSLEQAARLRSTLLSAAVIAVGLPALRFADRLSSSLWVSFTPEPFGERSTLLLAGCSAAILLSAYLLGRQPQVRNRATVLFWLCCGLGGLWGSMVFPDAESLWLLGCIALSMLCGTAALRPLLRCLPKRSLRVMALAVLVSLLGLSSTWEKDSAGSSDTQALPTESTQAQGGADWLAALEWLSRWSVELGERPALIVHPDRGLPLPQDFGSECWGWRRVDQPEDQMDELPFRWQAAVAGLALWCDGSQRSDSQALTKEQVVAGSETERFRRRLSGLRRIYDRQREFDGSLGRELDQAGCPGVVVVGPADRARNPKLDDKFRLRGFAPLASFGELNLFVWPAKLASAAPASD